MTSSKTVRGECAHCGAIFEVPAEAIGLAGECPHCHRQTEVLLAVVSLDTAASRKLLLWAIIGILILLAALAACIVAVHLAKKLEERHRQRAREIPWIEFTAKHSAKCKQV